MTKSFLRSVIFLSLTLAGNFVLGQKEFTLELNTYGKALPKKMRLDEAFKSSKDRSRALKALIATLYKEGYLAASIDSVVSIEKHSNAYLHLGARYKWAELRSGNVDPEILSSVRFKEKLFFGEELNPNNVASIYSSILSFCENNGYPFASVRLDSVELADKRIKAKLHLEKSVLVKIDSIIVRGDCRTAPIYLYNYINVRPGDLYDESQIEHINTRLKELPFIKIDKPYYVLFGEKETKLYLFISDKKSSNFSGILGILPDEATGKVTVTGDVQLKLKNALKRGELIDLNWRKLQTQTSDLRINFNYPYLFNTPFGVDLLFKLYKRDTTFVELNAAAGLQYLMRGSDNLRVYVRTKQSNKLSNSTEIVSNIADIDLDYYGIGISIERLDYRLNPRAGISLDFDGALGNKKVQTDELVDEEIVQKEEKSTQFDLMGRVSWFIPIGRRGTVKIGTQGGWMINEDLYTNELYRIGGIKSLRGADEESILASAYSIGTIEYRFLYETNASLYVFFDGAYYENLSFEVPVSDTPFGFGIGTTFETKAGIFSINYALGSQFGNPIKFNAGKVHFGFLSTF